MKRTLYLLHRWLGIAMCSIFFLWFASGIVMMYVEYPELTEVERITAASDLDLDAVKVNLAEFAQQLPGRKVISQVVVTSLLTRPIYQISFDDLSRQTIYADTGEPVFGITQSDAEDIAALYAKNSSLLLSQNRRPELLEAIEMDQWTVYGGLNRHRPLYKVALNNDLGSHLYVSSRTGEVVRDTHAWERRWNWVGSTIHWIYPMQLRKHSSLWENVVIWVSIAGILSVISGTVVGILRLRVKRRYKQGAMTPYKGMQKWHHVLGLFFTAVITMFVVSGLLSMNPFGVFDNKTSAGSQIARYVGEGYALDEFQSSLNGLQQSYAAMRPIKELTWQMVNGEGVLVALSEGPDNSENPSRWVVNVTPSDLAQRVLNTIPALIPESDLTEIETVAQYDNYYYTTHNRYKPLPVLRAKFSDDEASWFYLDAVTGEVLERSTQIDRVERWLYNGLHSLDFRLLLSNRPLWDVIVIVLSLVGIIFSITSLVMGWRRVRKTKLHKLKIKS